MRKLVLGFESNPSFIDNSKILYEYIRKNYSDRFEFVWLLFNEAEKAYFIENNISFLSISDTDIERKFMQIDIAFLTYTLPTWIPLKKSFQTFICLWHGVGSKKVVFLDDKMGDQERQFLKSLTFDKIDYFVTTSELMQVIFSHAFEIPLDKFILCGQPRVDALFHADGAEILKDKLGVDVTKYSKVLFHLPTFRQTNFRTDGVFNKNNIINLLPYEEKELLTFLKQNNYLLLIKYHNAEIETNTFENAENVIVLDNAVLKEKKIDISEIINVADMVLTDYSSAHADYLWLNRPVLFIQSDKDSYLKNRGTYFNDFDLWFPGPSVSTIQQFTCEVEKLFGDNDYYKRERNRYNEVVNNSLSNDGSHNCERLTTFLFERVIHHRHNEILQAEKAIILEKQHIIDNQQNVIGEQQQNIEQKDKIIREQQQNIEQQDKIIREQQQNIEHKDKIIREQQQNIEQQGVIIGGQQQNIEQQERVVREQQQSLVQQQNIMKENQEAINSLNTKINECNKIFSDTLQSVYSSNSWKVTKPLRGLMRILKK